jgi:hypothetical protein
LRAIALSEDARSQVTRCRGGHNRQGLTHAAFKATEAAAPEATEAAPTTASGIAGSPAASPLTCFKQRAHLAVRLARFAPGGRSLSDADVMYLARPHELTPSARKYCDRIVSVFQTGFARCDARNC